MTNSEHQNESPFMVGMIGTDTDPEFGSELERLHSSTRYRQRWLLACVMLIGVGSILSMRAFSPVQNAMATSSSDDVILTYLQSHNAQPPAGAGTPSTRAPKNVSRLGSPHVLQRNPFLMAAVISHADDESKFAMESNDDIRERRLLELESIVKNVTVESTMTGRTPLASISGEVLRTGESMFGSNEQITIVLHAVRGNSVVLKATDTTLNVSGEWIVHVGN